MPKKSSNIFSGFPNLAKDAFADNDYIAAFIFLFILVPYIIIKAAILLCKIIYNLIFWLYKKTLNFFQK